MARRRIGGILSEAALAGKRVIKVADSIVNLAVLIAVILLIVIGSYALWDSRQVYQTADSTRYAVYKPTDENGGLSFAELQEINPDVCAWLEVYGTHIDYPVVQGKENMTYVNRNAEGKYSQSGAIFLDKYCSRDFSDFSSILYGHHMEKHAMFGEIGLFKNKDYFEARRYGMLYYGGQEHGLEFFAFLHADAYDTAVFKTHITERKQQQAYIDMIFDRARHTRDINITPDEKIVLLSTCSTDSTNGRDILVGRITDEVFANPFNTEDGSRNGELIVNCLDGLVGNPWCLGILGLLLICLIALILLATLKKRRYRNTQEETNNEGDMV